MSRTADVLGELEAIGALGDETPSAQARVEHVRLEAGPPTAALLDARGSQMVEICDRIADKMDRSTEFLDGAAKMLQDLKSEILEMKRIWEPLVVEGTEEGDEGEDNIPEDDADGEVHETT